MSVEENYRTVDDLAKVIARLTTELIYARLTVPEHLKGLLDTFTVGQDRYRARIIIRRLVASGEVVAIRAPEDEGPLLGLPAGFPYTRTTDSEGNVIP